MLKTFIDKDTQQTIAVNPNSVKIVRDTPIGAKIIFNDSSSSYVIVTDSYPKVVERLNEKTR
jgi:hypothetical protein